MTSMIQQLRIYQIEPHLKAEFDTRFKVHASRIMKSYGFNIIAMWYSETDETTEFVYILSWSNEETMRKQWEAFMTDAEWENIKKKSRALHGEMVLKKVCDRTLNPTDWFNNSLYCDNLDYNAQP